MSNTELWDAVCTTDPDATKRVEQRGGFTAIDAYHQIHAATERFGPAGKGWGWVVEEVQYPPNDTVAVRVRLWWEKPEQSIVQYGQKKLNSRNGPDEDAFKKAITDAVTKCLSYLGFNADVFMGRFDDNKYVEGLRAAKRADGPAEPVIGELGKTELKAKLREFNEDLYACTDADQVDQLVISCKKVLTQAERDLPSWYFTKDEEGAPLGIKDRISSHRAELKKGQAA